MATAVGTSVQEIRDQLDILESQDAIRTNRTFGGHYAPLITGQGKLLLEQTGELGEEIQSQSVPSRGDGDSSVEKYTWDVFVAHASADKSGFVDALAVALQDHGLRVWYDDFVLRPGDSIRRSIEVGLRSSRCGVVVLSPVFLEREWPKRELDGLFQGACLGVTRFIPVLKDLTHEQVAARWPMVADRKALYASEGAKSVAEAICDALEGASPGVADLGFATTRPLTDNWIHDHVRKSGDTPALPGFLVPFAVTYVRGAPISRDLKLRPMSCQSWNRLDPGQRQRLRELVQWLGWKWEDYWDWSEQLWPGRQRPSA